MAASKASAKAAKKAVEKALTTWEIERKRVVDKARYAEDGSPRDILKDVPAFTRFARNGLDVNLTFAAPDSASWSSELATFVFDLTKQNMQALYDAAPGWGWNDSKKRQELFDDTMRYIIARQSSDGKPVAFVAIRFELEGEGETAYVYELQLAEAVQRKGLGKHLMQTVEFVAKKSGMMWVKLTVLQNNKPAHEFYTSKMKYALADDDPSHDGVSVAHELLSKCIDKAAYAAAEAKLERIRAGIFEGTAAPGPVAAAEVAAK